GAILLSGVTIGRGSIVGAGAVVAKNIPAWSVAVGNPARVVRSRKGPSVGDGDRAPTGRRDLEVESRQS
nr:hypothetical protein [Pseudonocardiales bacterium]